MTSRGKYLSNPLLKQDCLEKVAQDHIQMAFKDLQGDQHLWATCVRA